MVKKMLGNLVAFAAFLSLYIGGAFVLLLLLSVALYAGDLLISQLRTSRAS